MVCQNPLKSPLFDGYWLDKREKWGLRLTNRKFEKSKNKKVENSTFSEIEVKV